MDLPARLTAYGVIGAVLALALFTSWLTVDGWRRDAQRLKQVDREYLAYRSTIEGYRRGDQAARKEYEDDRAATARVRDRVPVQPVRLRLDGPDGDPAAGAGAAAPVGTPAAPARELQGTDGADPRQGEGPDIGPELYELADDADTLRDDFAACQRDLRRLQEAWPQCMPAPAERRRWWNPFWRNP